MRHLERQLRDEIQLTHKHYRREVVLYERPRPPAPRT
jgi:hypothetical protein